MKPMRSRDAGFVLPMLAVSLNALLVLAGFGTDIGSWYLHAQKLQRAADSAALAGAISLPDSATATTEVADALARNGIQNGVNGKSVVATTDGTKMTVSLTNSEVPTYFLKMLFPSISISRTSVATRSSPSTASTSEGTGELGSPFNVFGGGSLQIPGIPEQNFWAAINGSCSPKEDGDFFNATSDANKYNSTFNCGSGPANPDFTPGGYNYFISVPPPPSGGKVTIRLYDPAFNAGDFPGDVQGSPDLRTDFPDSRGDYDTAYRVYNTNGTPDDASDDGAPIVGADGASCERAYRAWVTSTAGNWDDFCTIPNNLIAAGGMFRMQVQTYEPWEGQDHGVNAFSIMAERSWDKKGCDSRTVDDCPRVFGRNAVSIYNDLGAVAGSTTDIYFADIGAAYAGSKLQLFLWDPGEGVKKLELVAPSNTPNGQTVPFDWAATPDPGGYSGMSSAFLDTSGTGPPVQANLSNNNKFNDRLVVITLTVPTDYASSVAAANGDTWWRIRYTVGNTPTDRTTWGLQMPGATGAFSTVTSGGPVYLVQQ